MIEGLRTRADANTLRLAVRLLERGARTALVRVATGLPSAGVRRLYAQVHGRRPPSGQNPQQAAVRLTPRRRHVHAALLATLYQDLTEGRPVLDPDPLVEAYELYEALAPADRQQYGLDINGAWIVARDLRACAIRLQACPHCDSPYLRAPERPPLSCPGCGQALPGSAGEPERDPLPEPAVGTRHCGRLRAIERDDDYRVQRALRLLRYQPRIAMVALATGLPEPPLAALYRDLHGKKPTSGPLPEGIGSLLAPRRRHVHAALLASLYHGLTAGRPVLDPDALVEAYELYAAFAPADRLEHGLDFNEAWIIARDLRTRPVHLRRCRACGGPWIEAYPSPVKPGCPVCALEAARPTGRAARRAGTRPVTAGGEPGVPPLSAVAAAPAEGR